MARPIIVNTSFASAVFVATLALAAIASPAHADDAAIKKYVLSMEQYKQHRGQDGVAKLTDEDIDDVIDGDLVVKKTDIKGTELRSVLAVKIVDVDALSFWLTVMDRPHYTQISDNITESIVSRVFPDYFYTYNVLDAPLVSTRHQVLEVHTNPKLYEVSDGKIWEQYWHKVDNIEAEIKHALKSPNLKNIKPDYIDGAVTVKYNKGSWYLYALPDGRTWVESFIINDPGGKVPQWIVKSVTTKATKTTFASYGEWAQEKVQSHMKAGHEKIMAPNGTFMTPDEIKALLGPKLKAQ